MNPPVAHGLRSLLGESKCPARERPLAPLAICHRLNALQAVLAFLAARSRVLNSSELQEFVHLVQNRPAQVP